MTWISDNSNGQKKILMGVVIILPTFPPSVLAIFQNTEPRDRTDYNPAFYFEGFMAL